MDALPPISPEDLRVVLAQRAADRAVEAVAEIKALETARASALAACPAMLRPVLRWALRNS